MFANKVDTTPYFKNYIEKVITYKVPYSYTTIIIIPLDIDSSIGKVTSIEYA
jgi:hypothetical protein